MANPSFFVVVAGPDGPHNPHRGHFAYLIAGQWISEQSAEPCSMADRYLTLTEALLAAEAAGSTRHWAMAQSVQTGPGGAYYTSAVLGWSDVPTMPAGNPLCLTAHPEPQARRRPPGAGTTKEMKPG